MILRKRSLQLALSLFIGSVSAECNVCRNGGQVLNPGHEFTMVDVANGIAVDWTCGWLEESVADVNPNGAQGEAFLCGLAQLWAEKECSCSGPPIPPLSDNVIDPNPACDLCAGNDNDFGYVPSVLANELVQTGIAGRMPCGGLYHALSEGVLPLSLCSQIRNNAASFCCNAPTIEQNNLPQPTSAGPPNSVPTPVAAPTNSPVQTCGAIFETCGDTPCCGNLDCKVRILGQPPMCSTKPRVSRQRLGRPGAGGAAGRARAAG